MTVELMQGFPPNEAVQVTLTNWRRPPFSKWSFQHVREIVPSADIPNDSERVWSLERSPVELDDLALQFGGKTMSFAAFLRHTDTDAIVILRRGKLVYERYRAPMTRDTPHILMSVSKSILGLLVGVLVGQGRLRVDALVSGIIPEVAGTAYDGATLRNLLDMQTGILFDENYLAASGAIIDYRKAQGWDPYGAGETPSDLRSFYKTLKDKVGSHGGSFHYVSPNTDLLGWVIERTTGTRYCDLVSKLLWKPMGARNGAYITVDRLGAPRCAGGFCSTVEDLARVGQLLVQGGKRDAHQIIPQAWIEDIWSKGDRKAWDQGDFKPYIPDLPVHYRSQWYTWTGNQPIGFGLGVFGQNVFVDRQNQIVIAKLSSQALPMDAGRIQMTMSAIEQVRRALTSR